MKMPSTHLCVRHSRHILDFTLAIIIIAASHCYAISAKKSSVAFASRNLHVHAVSTDRRREIALTLAISAASSCCAIAAKKDRVESPTTNLRVTQA